MKRISACVQVAFLLSGIFHLYPLVSEAQEPSDFVGYWHGRYTGNGVNVAVYFDRWLEDGKLKGVTTIVPFFIAHEEITINSDGTLTTSTPSTLGVLESTVTVFLPTPSNSVKTSRVTWAQSEGSLSGAGEFTWDAPASEKTPTNSELTGRYQGVLWPGLAATERIDVSMDIRVQEDRVTGTIKLPAEEVEIITGRRFHKRMILEVGGKTIRGIWAGSITPKGLHFHWDMGVGYGQAEFKKTESNSGGGEEMD